MSVKSQWETSVGMVALTAFRPQPCFKEATKERAQETEEGRPSGCLGWLIGTPVIRPVPKARRVDLSGLG